MTTPNEQGAASVLVAGAVGAVVVVLAGALVVTGVVADVHRARSAADLAALAAAAPLAQGAGPDCDAGGSVAAANGARLTACGSSEGDVVEVAVAVDLRSPARRLGFEVAVSRARAGLTPSAAPPPPGWNGAGARWGQRPVGGGGGGVDPLGAMPGSSR